MFTLGLLEIWRANSRMELKERRQAIILYFYSFKYRIYIDDEGWRYNFHAYIWPLQSKPPFWEFMTGKSKNHVYIKPKLPAWAFTCGVLHLQKLTKTLHLRPQNNSLLLKTGPCQVSHFTTLILSSIWPSRKEYTILTLTQNFCKLSAAWGFPCSIKNINADEVYTIVRDIYNSLPIIFTI